MKTQRLYYVEGDFGCALYVASNLQEARSDACREVGTYGLRIVRRATKADAAWVGGMGGRVPSGLVDA